MEGGPVTELADRPATASAGAIDAGLAGGRPVPDLVTEVPGPKARALIAMDARYTSPSLPRAYELVPSRGDGLVVEDVDGNLFLDFAAGIAVTSTGHAHPEVVRAIQRQAERLLHFSASDFYLPIYVDVCRELDRIAATKGGPNRAFLVNSGSEAIEVALKLARHVTGRQNVIAFFGAFHGRTYGAVTMTASKAHYHHGFAPMLPGVYHAPYGTKAGLDFITGQLFKRLIEPRDVAAIFVEPILGEGGYVVPEDDFLPGLREICDRYGILLVADEVQTGAGRTGKMWAVEHWGVEPDMLVLAKGIASGLPLGALVARDELFDWSKGAHGSTYGGNPLACAAALETIRLLEGGLVDNAARMGDRLMASLRDRLVGTSGMVREVRGKGLMIGIAMDSHEHAAAVQQACFQRGLLVLEAGDDAVRMCPALSVSAEQADVAVDVFVDAVAEVERSTR
jgi:4-aminobutyrate aminotransferase